jgi:hypothetical protein
MLILHRPPIMQKQPQQMEDQLGQSSSSSSKKRTKQPKLLLVGKGIRRTLRKNEPATMAVFAAAVTKMTMKTMMR